MRTPSISDRPGATPAACASNDDARTLIAGALHESGFLPSTGYVHTLRHDVATETAATLALLGYFNSYTCDWWVRRFVDRHVTAPVVNYLPLPTWTDEQVQAVAHITSELLTRTGQKNLPGGVILEAQHPSDKEEDLLSKLESLVALGFSLSKKEVGVVLEDFSDKGCSASLRDALMVSIK